jgi:hypothetical protein
MRVYLTKPDLESNDGKHLLELCTSIAADGKLELEEIKTLRRWLRENHATSNLPAAKYLHDVMCRITADGVIDRDELLDLFLAVERVIPVAQRTAVAEARKKRIAVQKAAEKEAKRVRREEVRREESRRRQEECRQAMRLRHLFTKIAGVTFQNDDGSERQEIISRCRISEPLSLRHQRDNGFSEYATAVCRVNGEQLGYLPEFLAEQICEEVEAGFSVQGILKNRTGGTADKPARGVNIIVFLFASDVNQPEREQYVKATIESELGSQSSIDYVNSMLSSRSHEKRPWWKIW